MWKEVHGGRCGCAEWDRGGNDGDENKDGESEGTAQSFKGKTRFLLLLIS